ncbi:MAG: hypothetical protein LCI02_23610 [Proteobacteria bacterium]|nr:hypothetical protein [Pseudomonadota bacterium]
MTTVFYSWQLDTPSQIGRNFIGKALEGAIAMLRSDAEVEEALRDVSLDSDTKGVSGSPPLVETIFGKIDKAAAFVADLTFVGERVSGKPTPNPNVAIEYGYALKALGHRRIVGVMNAAYGEPTRDSLPFDLGHLRFPISYNCPTDARDGVRRAERSKLAEQLRVALKSVLESSLQQPRLERAAYQPLQSPDGGPRFRRDREEIGVLHDGSPIPRAQVTVAFAPGAAMWLRVMPKYALERRLLTSELRSAFIHGGLFTEPLNGKELMNPHGVRGADGHGFGYVSEGRAQMLVYAFVQGEVWSMDTTVLRSEPSRVFFDPQNYVHALVAYAALLGRLGVLGPYTWMAGINGLKGRGMEIVGRSRVFPPSPCLVDEVVERGEFSGKPEDASAAIEPFVAQVFDAGNLVR